MDEGDYQTRDEPQGEVKTSGMAIAALILAIVPACITQLAAIGLGIGSLVAISKPENRLKGKGLAIAAFIISGLWSVMLPFIFILAGLLPGLSMARGEARKAACSSNLRQIGQAMDLYLMDYGSLPTTGEPGDSIGSLNLVLQGEYVQDARVFHCPSDSDGQPGVGSGPLTEDTCSYFYENTVSLRYSSSVMVAYDKSPDFHRDGRTVLFVDGHTEWLSEEEFQRRLAAQKAANAPPDAF